MTGARRALSVVAAIAMLSLGAVELAADASAEGLEGEGGASWRWEPVTPPELPNGQKSSTPIGLGRIGDIEFWAPNRGLLITAGNGSTIPPSLWAYNGESWHELSTVCGATDGRIAWAGPDEFWTISDGRPGQANDAEGRPPPLQDNTLCHFSGGQVVTSYASLAFRSDSYQAMHAASCITSTDCWFAGDPLPERQPGAFQLHWNGGSVSREPYPNEGHAVEALRLFGGQLYESVLLRPRFHPPIPEKEDAVIEPPARPPVLHLINPKAFSPAFEALSVEGMPLYGSEEFPEALGPLRLSVAPDEAGEEALWAAAGPVREPPEKSASAGATVLRFAQGAWRQALGPATIPSGSSRFPEDVINSIAADPSTESAWVALDSQNDSGEPSPTAPASLARISAEGTVVQEQLPSPGEGIGPKGAADKLTCPAPHDCWLATTQGWLFHLTDGSPLPRDGDPAFSHLITFRGPDAGVPPVVPDAPPVDNSGLLGELPASLGSLLEVPTTHNESQVSVPPYTHVRARIIRGNTLELRFHLTVRSRVRLVAKRHRQVVARTPMRTMAAGNRTLLLRLNPHSWPTKLELQTHVLSKLPTASTRGVGNNTVGTDLIALPRTPSFAGLGPLG